MIMRDGAKRLNIASVTPPRNVQTDWSYQSSQTSHKSSFMISVTSNNFDKHIRKIKFLKDKNFLEMKIL